MVICNFCCLLGCYCFDCYWC